MTAVEERIVIRVEQAQAKRDMQAFDNVVKAVAGDVKAVGNEGKTFGGKVKSATDKSIRAMRGFGRVLDVVRGKIGGFAGSIKRMIFSVKGLGTAIVSGLAVRSIIRATLEMEGFRDQIEGATNDSNATEKAIAGVRKQAMLLGRDLKQSIAIYSDLLPTLSPLLGTEGATRLFNQAQTIATGKGFNEAETGTFMDSIRRVYTRGEFNSRVYTQMANVIKDMTPFANALGMTTQELQTAKLSVDQFNTGLAALVKDQLDEANNVANSAGAAFRRLRSSLWDILVSIGESGLVQSLADLSNRFAAFSQTDQFDKWLQDTVKIVGDVLKSIGSGILTFVDTIRQAGRAIGLFRTSEEKAYISFVGDYNNALSEAERRRGSRFNQADRDRITSQYALEAHQRFGINFTGRDRNRRTLTSDNALSNLEFTGQNLGDSLSANLARLGNQMSGLELYINRTLTGDTSAVSVINPSAASPTVEQTEQSKNTFISAFREMGSELANFDNLSQSVAQRAFGGINSAIDELVTTGKLNFNDFAQSIIADLLKMQAKFLAFQALTGLFGSGVESQAVTNLASQAAGMPAIGGPRANGGNVMANKAYLVGERGPELFMPGSNGYVAPNKSMGNTTVSIVYNNDFSNADETTVERIQAELAVTRQQAVNDVMTTLQSGGNVTKFVGAR